MEPTYAIALVDVDGDGKLDLVRGNKRPAPSTVYLNIGTTFAQIPAWQGTPEGTETIAIGDVDGDGFPDLVRGNYDRGPTLYLDRGRMFAADTAWRGPVAESNVALGDVDGDGRLDLVCASPVRPIAVYRNIGGTFSRTAAVYGLQETSSCMALGDVNGDGTLDLVRGNMGQATTLYLNHGGAFDPIPSWHEPAAGTTSSIALGDIDGDGRLDLVCGYSTSGNTPQRSVAYRNDGAGFGSNPLWTGPPGNTSSLVLGDVDGDGRLDLLCDDPDGGARLYLNRAGTLDTTAAWDGPAEATASVSLGDIDGDGDLDVIRGNALQPATVYENLSGAFSPTPGWPSPAGLTHAVAVGDIDGDGRLDLVLGNAGERAELFLNDGVRLTPASWPNPVENTWSIALGDLDGDGRPDLVRGNYTSQASTVYRNTGNGFADQPISVGSRLATSCVALADIDGDGRLDLVMGRDQNQVTVVYRNVGNGRLDSVAALPRGYTQGVALGDIDGDGAPDLVRGNLRQPAALYFNRGGTFLEDSIWSALNPSESTYGVALGDIDGDGGLDLIRANSGQATLYLNSGATLAPAPAWAGLDEPTRSVALGDVDGDGRLDLLRGNFNGRSTLYRNRGGIFEFTPSWSGPPDFTESVALADLNGDGRPDLVCGNQNGAISTPSTLYFHTSPWIPLSPDTTPHNQLPNNAGYLRWVRVTPPDSASRAAGSTRYTIACQTMDPESDPLLLVGEYQFEGSPIWRPMVLAGSLLRTGPLATSAAGVHHEIAWDVSPIPFDRRNVVIRLRTVSLPGRTGAVQFIPSYLVPVGDVAAVGPLQFDTRLLGANPALPLGEAATVVVTPGPGMRIDSGKLFYRAPGRAEFDSTALFFQGVDLVGLIPGDRVSEAGLEYYVIVRNRTVRTRDPAADSLFHRGDVEPPQSFTSTVSTGDLQDQPRGRPISIHVDLPRGALFRSGSLFYRQGGAASYDSVAVDSASLSATVPGERVGARGLEYWIRVSTLTRRLTDPPSVPADRPHGVRVEVDTLAEPNSHPGGIYRMISIPLELPASSTLESILPELGSPYNPVNWRAFRWDSSSYVEMSSGAAVAAGTFRPDSGRAFWLISQKPHQVDTAPVPGRSIRTDTPYTFPLDSGWTQIGDPFDFPVAWRDVRAIGLPANDTIRPPQAARATYNGHDYVYEYVDEDVLMPFDGYWVWSPAPGVSLTVPPIESAAAPATAGDPERTTTASPGDSAAWRLQIIAARGGASDRRNFAGVATGAADGLDGLDRFEPPLAPGPGISLYFPAGTPSQPARSIDMRPDIPASGDASGRGRRWAFDVAGTVKSVEPIPVELSFVGMERVPRDLDVRLVDRVAGRTIDLREQPVYAYGPCRREFVPDQAAARFELLVGTRAYIDSVGTQAEVRETRLLPVYPNPLASLAIVRFQTARPGRVTLALFDVSGRRVRALAEGNLTAGYHEIAWHGDDERGNELPEGVYLLRLAAPGRVETRKVIKVGSGLRAR